MAVADYDANGFPDVFISKTEHDSINLFGQPISGDGHPVLLQNKGNSNHWLTVRLQGTTSNRDGVGAVVQARPDAFCRLVSVGSGDLRTEVLGILEDVGEFEAAGGAQGAITLRPCPEAMVRSEPRVLPPYSASRLPILSLSSP